MKKFLIAVCFVLGTAGFVSAQEAPKKAPAKVVVNHKKHTAKKADFAATEATTKADGTPDRRFKAAKEKKQLVRKVKKTGTAG